jgi:Rrf2 family iron-sulfur cluster assembly transcriptional regulator
VKLSSKGRYGVRALFDIAFHNEGGPTQIREIAEREAIPARFLEQIFQDLKRAGLVSAKRGPRGGYQLARPPAEISVGDVLRALEGPEIIAVEDDGARGRPQPDVVGAVFQTIAQRASACFDSVSLAEVCVEATRLGLSSRARPRLSYVI